MSHELKGAERAVELATASLANPDWQPRRAHYEGLRNDLRAAAAELSRLQEENERLRSPLVKLVKCDDDAKHPLQNGAGLLDCIDNHSQFYPSAELGDALAEARAALSASQEQGGSDHD